MVAVCRWCGAGTTEKFCSEDCRRDFHSACQLWGEGAYGAGNVSIWQLRTCLAQRARRDFAPEGNPAPEAKRISVLPGAAVPITEMTP